MSATKEYYLNYIGNDADIKNEGMFSFFDTNYINLTLLPFNYYPIYNNNFYNIFDKLNFNITDPKITNLKLYKNIKNEFENLFKNMKNDKLIYNKYQITPITITIIIIWIFVLLFVLKYIHYNYNILYIYFISTIIIFLLIFGSIWFLYVNSQLL